MQEDITQEGAVRVVIARFQHDTKCHEHRRGHSVADKEPNRVAVPDTELPPAVSTCEGTCPLLNVHVLCGAVSETSGTSNYAPLTLDRCHHLLRFLYHGHVFLIC